MSCSPAVPPTLTRSAPDDPVDFTSQLTARSHVLDVRPRRGHVADTRTDLASANHPVPSVVLLSRSCDAELDAVQALLRRAGVPSERVNSDELASLDLLIDPDNCTFMLNGRWLAPTVTWMRHFSTDAIEEGSASQAQGMFLRTSWQAAADQMAAISGTCVLARRPPLLSQLMLAQRNQVAVPQTIVTTDLRRAHRAFSCPRLVVKAVHQHFVEAEPGRLTGIFPTIVERCELPGAPCHGPPVVVQEYVEHDVELRAYYVGGRVHTFEVGKNAAADPWTAPETVKVRHVAPPPAVARATRVLASAMALRFAAFDFLVAAGTPVFLEVNPDGDWRWAERKSRTTAVTLAAARMLTELHHEMRQAMPSTVDHSIKPLDLLAFLSIPDRHPSEPARRPASTQSSSTAAAPPGSLAGPDPR